MTVISNPKKNSNFRRPYLSKNKKVNVSTIVINVPAHSGTLKKKILNLKRSPQNNFKKITHALFDNKYIAMAVPITSCMSDPMMATSTIIHKTNLGNFLYCL